MHSKRKALEIENDNAESSSSNSNKRGKTLQIENTPLTQVNANASTSYISAIRRMRELQIEKYLTELEEHFKAHEIPIGLLDRLLDYQAYHMNFVIDDSGSMAEPSDVKRKDMMSTEMRERFSANNRMLRPDSFITRWEEVEDRLHFLVDIFAYIPTQSFNFHFMNPRGERQNQSIFVQEENATPDDIKQQAHEKITTMFAVEPNGGTPLFNIMQGIINKSSADKQHAVFVFTDGMPDGYNQDQLKNKAINPFFNLLIANRDGKERACPVSFNSCTNNDADAEWMKILEKDAKFCSECDDYNSKATEIRQAQGLGFPFTRGIWMLLQILGAISPDDLDLIDEKLPFSRFSLETISGTKWSIEQYNAYWDYFPSKNCYADY